MTKLRTNGVLRDMTEAEEAQHLLDIDINNAMVAARAQAAIDKASGNQKLLDLGLSQAEVDALTN